MTRAAALTAALLLVAGGSRAADAEVHFERAGKAFAAGKYQEALALYDAVLNLKGESAAVRHNKALTYLAMNDPVHASAEAARSVALAPKAGRYRITLAVALLASEPPDLDGAGAALKAAEKLLKRARDHVGLSTAYYNLGFIAQQRRDHGGARRWYGLALKHNPDDDASREALAGLGPAPDQED